MAAGIAVAVVVLLSACGSSGAKNTSSGPASSSELAPIKQLAERSEAPITKWPAGAPTESVKVTPGKLLVDITLSATEPQSLRAAEGAVEAAKRVGWRGKILYGEFSASKTIAAIEQAIVLGANVIVTQGIEPLKYKALFKKAHEHGIVWITDFSDYPPSAELANAEVFEQTSEAGQAIAAKAIADAGGHGQFAIINYPEYEEVKAQTKGAKEEIEKCKKCELVSVTNIASSEAEKTLPDATTALLEKYPNLTAMINTLDSFTDTYQLPVFKSLKAKAKLYTFLGAQPTLEAMKKEEISGVIGYALRWAGWASTDEAIRLLAHKKVGNGGVPQRILTPQNVGPALNSGEGWTGDYNYKAEYERLWGLKK